jgi:hypothetical protein
MRFPNNLLKTVFYCFSPDEPDRPARGTGFFIRSDCREYKEDKRSHVYAVTNKHMVVGKDGKQKNTGLRVNTAQGVTQDWDYGVDDWVTFKDDRHDIAVLPLESEKKVDASPLGAILENAFLTKEMESDFRIGVGTDVMFTGRFRMHEGKPLNKPVARFGHIALYPETTVVGYDVYLIEGHSVIGFSGSPVFAYHPPIKQIIDPKRPEEKPKPFPPKLLGVLSSHWGKQDDTINHGIVGVVPTYRVLELIHDSGDARIAKTKKQDHEYFSKLPIG